MPAKKRAAIILLLIWLWSIAPARAERLPLRLFNSADGLASAAIFDVYKDSRGFLWFSTREGLSRFDGREFVNYRLDEQSAPIVNATYETADGTFWIAASGGIYRVEPGASGEIEIETKNARNDFYRIFDAEKVSEIEISPPFFEDSRGRLWGGGSELILIRENGELRLQPFDLGATAKTRRGAAVAAINETPDGSVWFGCDIGALRLLPDGRRILYPIRRETDYDATRSIVADEVGRIWVGHRGGVFVFLPETLDALADAPDQSTRLLSVEEKFVADSGEVAPPDAAGKMLRLRFLIGAPAAAENLQTAKIERIFKTFDNQIWVLANNSLFVFERGAVRRLNDTNGFPNTITSFAEDHERNVWIAGEAGAFKFNRGGMTSWSLADGLIEPRVHSFLARRGGEVFVVHGDWRVSRIVENKIESIKLDLPDDNQFLWTSPAALLDSGGDWWALSTGGLYRFAGAADFARLNKQKAVEVFKQKDGFRADMFYSAFEDSNRNLWISTRGTPDQSGLARFDRKIKQWRFFDESDNLPNGAAARAFAEDFAGNLWIGFYGGGFARFANNRFTDFTNAQGAPKGGILTLHIDARGRLWIGSTHGGVCLIENPRAETLEFKTFTIADGLASNNVRAVTSDYAGNIYVGTVRGVDRLNPETKSVRHYSTRDGLVSDNISAAFRDQDGALWFGTASGLSKLEPAQDAIVKPGDLRVLISSLRVAGRNYAISEFGRASVENLRLSPAENNIQIGFSSIGSGLRYQYKLDGAWASEWSQPTAEPTFNVAGLAPGSYKILARVVDSNNRTGEAVAAISFSVAAPFWMTWQFVGALILLAGAAVFLLDRYRVAKTRQVENALVKSQFSEKAAKESETRFRTLAETASDGIVTIDEASRIVFVNPAIEKIFGYKPAELVGENLTILMPEKMRAAHNSGFGRYLQTNRKNLVWNGIELPAQHKTGAEIPIEVSFGEFERDGRKFFTGIIRDITERRNAEAALQKSREERLKELQRVRTRIATDLHDDIGSSLTQIAVLTEVARASAVKDAVKAPLERISSVSNDLVDAMADIVWAINPKKDSWRELVLRMRRFASDVLTARDIEFEFVTPETDLHIRLGANIRRELFSIFKELINNTVRHSGASEALIEFEIVVGIVRLKIVDNGRGFDVETILSDRFAPEKGGNGLVNIRRRVADLNGSCDIRSSPRGTTIEIFVPLQKEPEAISLAIRVDSDGSNGSGLH